MTQHRLQVSRLRHTEAVNGARALGWSALLFSLLLVLAACGTDDGDDATEEAVEATVEATNATEADDSGGTDDSGSNVFTDSDEDGVPDAIEELASETGGATVTIGDETFEFSFAGTLTIDETTYIGRCESFFGMILGSGFAADGRDITVDMEIPPVDWETYEDERFDPPAIEVEDAASNASWVADQGDESTPGGGIGEYEQEGVTASGAATFINQWATDSEPVEGTFELDCDA